MYMYLVEAIYSKKCMYTCTRYMKYSMGWIHSRVTRSDCLVYTSNIHYDATDYYKHSIGLLVNIIMSELRYKEIFVSTSY